MAVLLQAGKNYPTIQKNKTVMFWRQKTLCLGPRVLTNRILDSQGKNFIPRKIFKDLEESKYQTLKIRNNLDLNLMNEGTRERWDFRAKKRRLWLGPRNHQSGFWIFKEKNTFSRIFKVPSFKYPEEFGKTSSQNLMSEGTREHFFPAQTGCSTAKATKATCFWRANKCGPR